MTVEPNDLIAGPVTPANGVDTISLDFYVESGAWLEVYAGASETPLVYNVDYTFAGEETSSGVVTLTTPADGSTSYAVYLQVPLRRDVDLSVRGEFRSAPFNAELDRLWLALQNIAARLNRTLRLSRTADAVTGIAGTAAARAGQLIGFSADGTAIGLSGVTVGTIASAEGFASDAADARDAAEGFANDAATVLAAVPNWAEFAAWETATAYQSGQFRRVPGAASPGTYVCVTDHTSGDFATDLASEYWVLVAADGSSGSGTGDLIAANTFSEIVALGGAFITAARQNLLVPGRFASAIASNDFNGDYNSRETCLMRVAASPLNGPPGGQEGDYVLWQRADSDNIDATWFHRGGGMHRRSRVSGAWDSWREHSEDAAILASAAAARVPDVIARGTGNGAFSSGALANVTVMDRNTIGAALSANELTLPAGTYYLRARSHMRLWGNIASGIAQSGTVSLRNETTGQFIDENGFRGITEGLGGAVHLQGYVTIAAPRDFALRLYRSPSGDLWRNGVIIAGGPAPTYVNVIEAWKL